MNDLVGMCCERAARRFGGTDGVFNAAGFGLELCKAAGVENTTMDGHIVKAILCGRPDVSVLSGGSHFRLYREEPTE